MSLESAEWRDRGPPPPPSKRRPTVGDRLARFAAVLILVAVFTFSVFALSLVRLGLEIVIASVVVGLVFLLFRLRELSRRVEELQLAVESQPPRETAERPGSGTPAPEPPGAGEARHD